MTPDGAVYVGLVLARVGAFVAVAPPFAGRTPRMIRIGLALALTSFYLGAVGPAWERNRAEGGIDSFIYMLALIREALLGTAMGFAFGLFFLPARIAGEFITVQVGLNVSPIQSATGTDTAGPITTLYETLTAIIFLSVDGHHLLLAGLHGSFSTFPLGGTLLPEFRPMLDGLASAYEAGLLLGGPLALCLFLLAVSLALMARAAPQLNIYSVGFTLQVLVVLLGGLFLLPDLVTTIQNLVLHTPATLAPPRG